MTASLAGVTFVAPDLDRAIAAYRDHLGYRAGAVERVGEGRALGWAAPRAAAARMVELRPESGEERFIRLVEGDPDPAFRPFVSPGWAAAEIVVQDVEALATRLADSPFTIVGPPAVLDFEFTDRIKAMQVIGPCGEALYLTQIDGEVPGFALPEARSFVGQLFIMVMAARTLPDGAAALAALGGAAGPVFEARIEVLSDAFDLPRDTRHSLTTIAFGDESYVEIDLLPADSSPRPVSSIGLPSGIALASFLQAGRIVDIGL
jgi:catechol 2,3-dioxygenase-like lactoylglutathione lyase family enzyme